MAFRRGGGTGPAGPVETWKEIMTRGDAPGSSANREALLTGLAGHSRLVQRLRRRYEDELPLLAAGPPTRETMEACLAQLGQRGHDTGAALRILRQLVMERLVVLDCEQGAPLETVTHAVTELAELALDAACAQAFRQLDERHGAPMAESGQRARMWVIGMGKLGARELNVSSDIDLIYVYDHDGDTAGNAQERNRISNHEYFAKVVRHIYQLVGETTEHGFVFRVDLALRPNGNSGLLVTSITSFESYQGGRGSNTAWTWEHQALTRARFAAGCSRVAARFEATRRAVLTAERDAGALRDEVRTMREKVRRARPVPDGRFDVKHSAGGMMDVEFAVQFLVLSQGARQPLLLDNAGNIALLQRAEAQGLLPAGVGTAAADAYRDLRRAQHRARLDEQPTQFDPALYAQQRDAVLALWQAVFLQA